MTLPEYIAQTRSTDLVNTVKHAALGLISEIGEVYGVLARIERGDDIERAERMTAELGDVAWYLARLCDLENLPADNGWRYDHDVEKEDFDSLASGLFDFGVIHLRLPGGHGRGAWSRLSWSRWTRLCYIENLDPTTVLQANLTKLRDRQARKALQGDGDNR